MCRECVNISSNVSSCVVFSQNLFHCCGGVGLLSQSAVPSSADQYVAFFSLPLSLSEEKTQLVLNVDKQLEEARELVRLWSVIFSSSHFLNYEFTGKWGGGSFHRHQTAAPVLSWRWHDVQTCSLFTWQKGGFLVTWLLPSNLLLSDTPMTHFKPLSRGGRLHVAV